MDNFTAILAVVSLCCVYAAYRKYTRISIAHLKSPKYDSFLLGHSPDLYLPEFGVTEAKWQAELGNIFRIKGSLGEDQLFVADPKALQYIFQTSAYDYKRPSGQRAIAALLLDRGVLWAEGETHQRQRKVMLPAFGFPETKAFLPIFMDTISHIVDKWSDIVAADQDNSSVLDVSFWMGRATLDAIGIAAFDYEFGSVEDTGNPLTKSYDNLLVDGFGAPSPLKMVFEQLSNYVPEPVMHALYQHLPGHGIKRLHENRSEVHKIGKALFQDKQETLLRGKGKKDVMSLLVKANASENERSKLRDDELIPQMRTILLAGHETTANTISWTLYELAKSPHIQKRLREDILQMQAKIQARGDTEFTPADFENMPYTVAVMKETLRMYPIAFRMIRESVKNDVIPLFTPITTKSGEVVNEIPIHKGTIIYASVVGYNRNKEVWGDDAFEYKPERWLDNKMPSTPALGVYGNLLTFSAGVRTCLGWRFAVVEIQAFIIGLLLKFEVSIPEGSPGIRKDRSGVITPMVRGQEHLGAQLPLKVSLLPN